MVFLASKDRFSLGVFVFIFMLKRPLDLQMLCLQLNVSYFYHCGTSSSLHFFCSIAEQKTHVLRFERLFLFFCFALKFIETSTHVPRTTAVDRAEGCDAECTYVHTCFRASID